MVAKLLESGSHFRKNNSLIHSVKIYLLNNVRRAARTEFPGPGRCLVVILQ